MITPIKKAANRTSDCVQQYNRSAIIAASHGLPQRAIHAGLKRFRRFNESRSVIQVKSESTLVNKGSNLKIHANDIVPFARKRVAVAAA